jgi:hypothetical protein
VTSGAATTILFIHTVWLRMCIGIGIGIEYFLEGERKSVYFDSPSPELPVRLRGGAIGFYRWGARSAALL